jgi:photosystem II stability/assembly factor-like uncharacterized protein
MLRNEARLRNWTAASAAVLFSFGIAPVAHANGAFPDEFSVHFPGSAPHRIYVGANFGLIVSEDDGATWRYACEPWVTMGSSAALSTANVSFYQLTATDVILALSTQVTRSDDDACTWPAATGALDAQILTDIFPDPNDADFVVVVVDVANGSALYVSHDGGQTFVDPPIYQTNALLTGVELARSTPGLMYATSISIAGSAATLLRSEDSGQTWTSTSIPTPAGTEALILAVDPLDSDTIYLRVVGALNDSIVVSTDGGQTFNAILSIQGQFSAFLRAEDGTLYAGTLNGVLYTRAPGATDFTSRSTAPHFRCLGQRAGSPRIYACGDIGLDLWDLGYSDDNGVTFTALLNFDYILGPLTCAPVSDNCQAHWERIQGVLGIDIPPSDAGTTPDSGTSTPDAGPPTPPSKGGCAAAPGGNGWAFGALLLGLACIRRRRARPMEPQ